MAKNDKQTTQKLKGFAPAKADERKAGGELGNAYRNAIRANKERNIKRYTERIREKAA